MKTFKEKFQEAVEKAKQEANEVLKGFSLPTEQLQKISEKYGIPIRVFIGESYQGWQLHYTPKSVKKKWGDDEEYWDVYEEVKLDLDLEAGTNGWIHSQYC